MPALADTFNNTSAEIHIVPNTLSEKLWRRDQSPITNAVMPIRMLYMGTATHDADLALIFPSLDSLIKKHPGSFTLTVIGVTESLPNLPWIERLYQPRYGSIYPNFVSWFLEQGPFDIGLSPLVESEFNRGKSDIKCLDYIAAGILPVVSDVLPYQSKELDDFIIKVKNTPEAWYKSLEDLVRAPELTREQASQAIKKGQRYLWQHRSTKQASKQIEQLLEKLVK